MDESIRQVTADVDETKLSLVITNLVENAMKYNIEEGWVRVTVMRDQEFFYLKVADSGIGIPEEMQDHFLTAFSGWTRPVPEKPAEADWGLPLRGM